ncbi:MAG: leucine-rich repeat domain-containing protein [Bacteroidaceae bacterium]|nr:leucine-rich repeat domain-containing protein [Bacteroidaceae bacterium]
MKKTFFFSVISSLLFLGGCSKDVIEDSFIPDGQEVKRITVTLPEIEITSNDDVSTRAEFKYEGSKLNFYWTADDVMGVFPEKGAQVDFPIGEKFAGLQSAQFDGGGWALKTSYSYAVYAPYDYYNRDKTKIPMDYTGQTQKKANDFTHLNKYNYFSSTESIKPKNQELDFKVNYIGTVFWLAFNMPVDATLKEIRLISDNLPFITKAHLNISDEKPSFSPVVESQSISLKLNNIAVKANEATNFYLWVLPRNYFNSNITAEIVTTDDIVYETTLFAAGTNANANLPDPKVAKGQKFTRPNDTYTITFKSSEANKVVNAMKDLYNALGSPSALATWASATKVSDFASDSHVVINSGKIIGLSLYSVTSSGTIPESIGDLTDLQSLDLSYNSLTGVIPESIGNLTNLTDLNLSGNNFTSYTPSSAPQLASDVTASSAPTLASAFPTTIGNLTKLKYLTIQNSNLTGPIPSSIGNLKQLVGLHLGGNNINGDLPTAIGNLTALETLDLSYNDLTGDFVNWFFNELPELTSLKNLYLDGNNLTGEVTTELQESERWQNLTGDISISSQKEGKVTITGAVERIEFDKDYDTPVIKSGSITITATCYPETALNRNVIWSIGSWYSPMADIEVDGNTVKVTIKADYDGSRGDYLWIHCKAADGNGVNNGLRIRIVDSYDTPQATIENFTVTNYEWN